MLTFNVLKSLFDTTNEFQHHMIGVVHRKKVAERKRGFSCQALMKMQLNVSLRSCWTMAMQLAGDLSLQRKR